MVIPNTSPFVDRLAFTLCSDPPHPAPVSMPGLPCWTRPPQGLLSSLAFPQEDPSRLVSNQTCCGLIPRCRYYHRCALHRESLASGMRYSIQLWLPARTQVAEGDNSNNGIGGEEEEDEEDKEEREDEEEDLADMVHDFIENGSETLQDNSGFPSGARSCGNRWSSPLPSRCESLQAIMEAMVPEEKEIASHLTKLVLNASELDLQRHGEDCCSGGCLDHLAIKHLQMLGYQASACRSRWQSNGKLPGGEYEYISVSLEEKGGEGEKVITIATVVVDLDFRAQFEIARPAPHYSKVLQSLPLIFVGREGRLDGVLRVMSDAARHSLHQSCMPLPPWRTLDYLRAKWRRPNPPPNPEPASRPPSNRHGHCIAQLNRLKQAVVQSGNT